MYGAVLGDIIGSRFEFRRHPARRNFRLFTDQCHPTDDTILTLAVWMGIRLAGKDASEEHLKGCVIELMRDMARHYPNAGYGGAFYRWVFGNNFNQPYGSYGNGSAMRVSAAGWLYDDIETTRRTARWTAEVTHNHPEGIKAAECTAAVIYLARTGSDKDEIRAYVEREFGYDTRETLGQMRKHTGNAVSCQDTMPKALRCFYDGESFEEIVRNAVHLGGDTDTVAAIAGSMADAYYGIPKKLLGQAMQYLDGTMLYELHTFDEAVGRGYANVTVDAAVYDFHRNSDGARFTGILDAVLNRMLEEGEVRAPMVDINHVMDRVNPEELITGGQQNLDEDIRFCFDHVSEGNGETWMPLYTDQAEQNKGVTPNVTINVRILTLLEAALNDPELKGVVINPFDQYVKIPMDFVRMLVDQYYKIMQERN